MNLLKIITALLGMAMMLTACSSVSPNDYANNKPTFIPQNFFDGHLVAHGVVKNRSGKVIRYFNADIDANWKDEIGTLSEKFIFDDGETQYRVWTLMPQKSDDKILNYSATAGDVIGNGVGKAAGNAFNLHYVLAVKVSDKIINLRVNDWMWLVDENTVLNESTLTKFGFNVGSIQLTILKSK